MAAVNPDLQKERDGASFKTEELACMLYDFQENLDRKRYLEKLADDDPVYQGVDPNFLSRSELHLYGWKKLAHAMEQADKHGFSSDPRDNYIYMTAVFPWEIQPMALQGGMFLPTLTSQASQEQQDRWLPLARANKMIGTYAQTELGHGTHVRGLETTATYDAATQEFIMHTPTASSIKWWPGGLGKTSNYALVLAQLITQGINRGVHPFMVQLRDMDTHQPLHGVTVGDIGPKFGFHMIDNGFLQLDRVRIPRTNMLMKIAQVEPDGTFVKAKHDKLGYGTMVFVRSMITWGISAMSLAQCTTIAVRYSCVRRQSELRPGGEEPQILDFTTQQYKLLTNLATAYAVWFAGVWMRNTYFTMAGRIADGEMEVLPELHGLSACLKAYASDMSQQGMEVCRMSCGGHGFSQASGIPKIYTHAVAACTYEGENTVMYLQAARYLMKMYNEAQRGQKLGGSVAYLNGGHQTNSLLARDMNLKELLEAFRHRAYCCVQNTHKLLKVLEARGKASWEAFNMAGPALVRASRAHVENFVLSTFVDKLEEDMSPAVKAVLTRVAQLYALYVITQNAADFMRDNYLSSDQLSAAEVRMVELLGEIRPDAVALVDSFDFNDRTLGSILGRYDGNVYENMYKWAKQSPLNKTEVHEAYYKYQKAMMNQSKL
eukprot:GHVU01112285.1.p1 GENE.GHVU01112285.1~~GHVU01112285.1.p1  ORF type:complete len:660 (+),score=64.25 GHVU01112285.1:69-2048(+)